MAECFPDYYLHSTANGLAGHFYDSYSQYICEYLYRTRINSDINFIKMGFHMDLEIIIYFIYNCQVFYFIYMS